MAMNLFFSVLSSLISVTVSSDVYVSVGHSVQLKTQVPVPEFDEFQWVLKSNPETNVLKYYKESKSIKPHSSYKDRVEFNEETYSLTLKNLQKTDSGKYEAKASGEKTTVVAVFSVSVLDPVEAPVLSHQPIRDSCNFTITCRGHELYLNSSCDKETCEEKEVTSPEGVTLSLSVSHNSIICNHSNPASWKVANLGEPGKKCTDKGVSGAASPSVWLMKIVMFSIICCVTQFLTVIVIS